MTFLELQDAVIGARFDATQRTAVKRWINARYAWVWGRHEWPFKKNAIANLTVTAADSTPTMPTGVRSVNRIYDNLGAEVKYLQPEEFDDFYTNSTSTGKPYHWTMINSQVYLGPTPDAAYTFKIAYEARITVLSADGDLPLIPTEYHPMLVPGAIAAGLREENDPTAPGVEEEFQMLYAGMVEDLLPPDRGQPRQYGRDDL